MPLRVDNVRQASIGTIAKTNDTLRNASHASAFSTYRRMKCMGGAWKESKELDVRAQAFQLISIFNWKLDRECIDGVTGAVPRELSISTEQTQVKGVLVAVRDTGPGIDGKHLERVFQPFYTTKSSGVGMGLSICRSIIDAHGGRLWTDANEPRGAVFQFTLPGVEKELMNSASR